MCSGSSISGTTARGTSTGRSSTFRSCPPGWARCLHCTSKGSLRALKFRRYRPGIKSRSQMKVSSSPQASHKCCSPSSPVVVQLAMRKENRVSVGLRTGVHSPGQMGKGAFHGGHRLRLFKLWHRCFLYVVIDGHCDGRSGFLFLVFLLRRVAAINADKGPNDGDEGADKAKSEQTCD
ncbi:hypothetical protein TYRP_006392 [Tyrophagus putrescentiae]|nr:hypothetical protein TYRP_006392 [Tyrophagus putrescentiae]